MHGQIIHQKSGAQHKTRVVFDPLRLAFFISALVSECSLHQADRIRRGFVLAPSRFPDVVRPSLLPSPLVEPLAPLFPVAPRGAHARGRFESLL